MLDRVRILEDLDADLALEPPGALPAAGPVVVVAAHERDSDAAADGPSEGLEQRRVARWRRSAEVEPEVEDVAQEVQRRARLQPVEEGDQVALLGPVQLRWPGPQVNVREEVDGMHVTAKTSCPA